MDYLTLTFPRIVANIDLTYIVEATETIESTASWQTLATSTMGGLTAPQQAGVAVTETGTGAVKTVEVRDNVPINIATPRRLLRLKVSR